MAHIAFGTKRWPGGVVPFIVDPFLQNNANAAFEIQAGIALWQTAVGGTLSFVPLIPFFHKNWIRFTASAYVAAGRCNSHVGMQGGEQRIRCSLFAINMINRRTIAHEIGHALGLQHEHQRMDRDSFVSFNSFFAYWLAGESPTNFKKLLPPWNMPFGSYDCTSLMHYRTRAVMVSGNVFTYLQGIGACSGGIGGSPSPTTGDVAAINQMY